MTSGDAPEGRRRPGRPARLSRDAIVSAAEEMVVADGVAARSMRRIAERLDSAPMSLYRHVADKEQLMALLLDRVVARVPHPALPEAPDDRIRLLWRLLHDEFARHSWAVDVLRTEGLAAPSARWLVDAIAEAFLATGLTPDDAAAAYWCVWLYTLGELEVRRTGRPPSDDGGDDVDAGDGHEGEDGPGLDVLRAGWSLVRDDDEYARALDRILRGWLPRS